MGGERCRRRHPLERRSYEPGPSVRAHATGVSASRWKGHSALADPAPALMRPAAWAQPAPDDGSGHLDLMLACPDGSFPDRQVADTRAWGSFKSVEAIVKSLGKTALAMTLVCACPRPAWASMAFWFENATVKVRQDALVRDRPTFAVKAAQNEFEPFQLVIKNLAAVDESGLDVEIGDFQGPGGATIASQNVTVMLEQYLAVTHKSDDESELGEWPDALCPKVDAYYHEPRAFFPFHVGAGRTQPIWFDLFVPASAAAGSYTATVKVKQGGAELFSGPVTLTVWGFGLPATSSYQIIFGLNSSAVHYGHFGDVWTTPGSMNTVQALQRLYMRAGLRHRISFSGMPLTLNGWDGATYATADATRFSASLQGFFGDGDPGVEYGQSEITTIGMDFGGVYQKYAQPLCTVTPAVTQPPQTLLDEVRVRAQTLYGLLTPAQRAVTYVLPVDEPGGGEVGCGSANPDLDYNSAKAIAQAIRDAGLKTRITKRRIPQLLDASGHNAYFDTWIVPFNGLVGKDWTGPVDHRADYTADIAAGAQLWWYQSCMTTGCSIQGGSEYDGYVQYLVEFPAVRNRVFQWLAFAYDVSGELYWDVTANYYLGETGNNTGDPWYSLWNRYMTNGEGTFFYPGVVDTVAAGLPYTATTGQVRGAHTPSIGGIHDIPIESFRLKMIREGLEDYEYMTLLKQLGDAEFAKTQILAIATNTYSFSENADDYYAAREAIAQRILTLQGAIVCGDALCSPGEEATCPGDCPAILPDAGGLPGEADAAVSQDGEASSPPPDAEVLPGSADATVRLDGAASSSPPDAGLLDPLALSSGCGCGSSRDLLLPLSLIGYAGLLLRRRSRS